jgi:hypothetical protein
MNQDQVTLCVFHDYAQAREVANRLNAAGIPTEFSGEAASTAGGGFAPAVVTIRLEVPENFLDQACAILNAEAEERGLGEQLAEGPPGEDPGDEGEEEGEAAPSPLKEMARFALGPILFRLDRVFAILEGTRSPERSGEKPPSNIWYLLLVVVIFILLLVKFVLMDL